MKTKMITLCTITMVGLLLAFAMMNIGTSTKISGILSHGVQIMFNRLGDAEYTIYEIDFMVRKIGHFVFYALLSTMIAIILFKKFNKLYLSVVLSSVATLTLAFMDEFIQHYAKGRNASVFDIVIDMAGAAMGLLIFSVTVWVIDKKEQG